MGPLVIKQALFFYDLIGSIIFSQSTARLHSLIISPLMFQCELRSRLCVCVLRSLYSRQYSRISCYTVVWVELLYRSLEKIIEMSVSDRFCLQKCRADAVVDHADQHGGRHVLSSALPRSHRLSEEVQPATPAGDNVQAVRGNDSDSEPHLPLPRVFQNGCRLAGINIS